MIVSRRSRNDVILALNELLKTQHFFAQKCVLPAKSLEAHHNDFCRTCHQMHVVFSFVSAASKRKHKRKLKRSDETQDTRKKQKQKHEPVQDSSASDQSSPHDSDMNAEEDKIVPKYQDEPEKPEEPEDEQDEPEKPEEPEDEQDEQQDEPEDEPEEPEEPEDEQDEDEDESPMSPSDSSIHSGFPSDQDE